jgi:hypothetical protein
VVNIACLWRLECGEAKELQHQVWVVFSLNVRQDDFLLDFQGHLLADILSAIQSLALRDARVKSEQARELEVFNVILSAVVADA